MPLWNLLVNSAFVAVLGNLRSIPLVALAAWNLLDDLAALSVLALGSIAPAFDFFGAAKLRASMASFSGLSAF